MDTGDVAAAGKVGALATHGVLGAGGNSRRVERRGFPLSMSSRLSTSRLSAPPPRKSVGHPTAHTSTREGSRTTDVSDNTLQWHAPGASLLPVDDGDVFDVSASVWAPASELRAIVEGWSRATTEESPQMQPCGHHVTEPIVRGIFQHVFVDRFQHKIDSMPRDVDRKSRPTYSFAEEMKDLFHILQTLCRLVQHHLAHPSDLLSSLLLQHPLRQRSPAQPPIPSFLGPSMMSLGPSVMGLGPSGMGPSILGPLERAIWTKHVRLLAKGFAERLESVSRTIPSRTYKRRLAAFSDALRLMSRDREGDRDREKDRGDRVPSSRTLLPRRGSDANSYQTPHYVCSSDAKSSRNPDPVKTCSLFASSMKSLEFTQCSLPTLEDDLASEPSESFSQHVNDFVATLQEHLGPPSRCPPVHAGDVVAR